MRQMTPISYETVHRLRKGIANQLEVSSSDEVDVLGWMGRTALELVDLGFLFDPLIEDVPSAYEDALRALMPTVSRLVSFCLFSSFWSPLVSLQERYPALEQVVRKSFWLIPSPALQEKKRIINTMDETTRMIFAQKKNALRNHDSELKFMMEEGKDLMNVLLRANLMASEEDKMPEEELIAQMSYRHHLKCPGQNSASAVLAFRCSRRLRAEILEARAANGGHNIGYDDLEGLPYVDAVCQETLRLYPPVPIVTLQAMHDVTLPPLTGNNGSSVTSIPIPKGTTVATAIYSCNRNKAIWGETADSGSLSAVMEAKVPGVYSNL
ncbi:uncharacterized protein PHACADRAFT_180946 [Phanerochaete carnosa HHB-10118-sp]|uniref:Cytochrome P450 n=1 Tax=Phanerochaete carnosa (strain HHB-10118-sp) TaxID=650164 RepID=K5V7X4_PHACS|nr:uncharacterized protein PHACADRAFT_180946 [Phanerochaete carnosa HHB-10118-sp]EKM58851.1 hypothetical protein PHACADRAFT_180946 [Phanerochaete carnosa HHB-10118-sp]